MRSVRMLRYLLVIFVACFFVSCTIKQDHGYDFNNEDLKHLKIKSSSKAEIQKAMGSPSAMSSIDKNVWYYIYLKTKSIAILRPKVNNYKVVEVHFDKHDKLSSVILYTNDKIKKLNFKQWESPLRGSKEDLLQDFLYNMGRFNKAAPVKK